MKFIKDIGHDLKADKKLWITAVILVVLAVVWPMRLADPGEPTAVVDQPVGLVNDDDGPQLGLTRASTTGFARPPRVNDDRLDPFASRAKKSSAASKDLEKAVNDVIDGGGSGGSGGGGNGGGGGGGGNPGPSDGPKTPEADTEPEVETEQDDLLSILTTDSTDADAEPVQINDIRTLSPLVNPEEPFLVYVGKTSDNSASFLVSSDVTFSGDGACAPSPTDCRTLTLGIGQTAEFTMVTDKSRTITVTVLDIETKAVKIGGDADTEAATQLQRAARTAGAKALKSVLKDESVVKALTRAKVKIRH